jgi:saccharopine dehydrogenase-like NADP-dependent oxidoreductase
MFHILVIGGYGRFGLRIARMLATNPRARVTIAGRDAGKAMRAAASLGAHVSSISLDRDRLELARIFVELKIRLVIHAAGPFQGQDYRVAKAAIEAGCHYADLADGRDYVCGIKSLDRMAKQHGVLVISGASSVPALTAAVVDHFQKEFASLREVRHGIAAAGWPPPGEATIAAVLSYCGKRFSRLEAGQMRYVFGWQPSARRNYPDPVGRRSLAALEVPDLQLLPERYPSLKTIVFEAGLSPRILQYSVTLVARLTQYNQRWDFRGALPFMGLIGRMLGWLGSGASAMHVDMRGLDHNGQELQRLRYVVAEHGYGPYIPCAAAVALARKLMDGRIALVGAMPCLGLITLEEYLSELMGLSIRQVLE